MNRRKLIVYAVALVALAAALAMLLWPRSAASPHATVHKKRVSAHAKPVVKQPVIMQSPKVLRIPSLKLEAPVAAVGTTKSGDMAAPREASTVGWYKFGAIPGVPGNAVLAGHLDVHGKPAVFWDLQKLQKNDKIEIEDTQGQKAQFVVSSSQRFTSENAPLEQIFGTTSQVRLNLITCAGSWQRNQRDYSHRLVVFATLLK
jgi:sortase (surface protein transpeptidase)